MPSITVLIGTMTGTAELVAESVRDFLESQGHPTSIMGMDRFDADAMVRLPGPLLICTSTHGDGDVPDNARALYDALLNETRPLAHVRYGIVGLGDRVYPTTFNRGGARFDEALLAARAVRVGPRLEIDASSGTVPEDEASRWCVGWLKELEAQVEFSADRLAPQAA